MDPTEYDVTLTNSYHKRMDTEYNYPISQIDNE